MSQIIPVSENAAVAKRSARHTLIDLLQSFARLGALIAVFVAFRISVGPSFVRATNVENIVAQSAVYAMAGLGMTMVIITGGIDLAVGSTIALAMVITAMILDQPQLQTMPVLWTIWAVVGGTLAATLVGLVQGLLITGLQLVPFIVTLGGLQIVRGLAKGVADNQEINPPDSNWLYQNLMAPVQGAHFSWQLMPLGCWATLVAALLAAGLLRFTKLGRRIYAVGSSEATARLCGVPVIRTKLIVYALAGAFAGLAGVLEFSKLNIGQPTGAVGYELYAIAACVIGGCSLMGGVGTVAGTVTGALIIGTLNAGAQQAGLPKWKQEIAIGAIIVIAVALDQLRIRFSD